MDDISFEYDGNRIVKATNGGPGPYFGNTMHYADHADEPVEFAYDADGNLVSHADKGISRIRYNKISQPDILEFHDQSTVRYTYTGTGRKLRVDYCVVPNSIYMPDYPVFPNPDTLRVSRSYYGNHVYDSDSLTMVLFDGGYISFNGNVLNPRYHFYVTDHLGSVRVVADAKGNVEERDGYHPYGATDDSGRNTDFQPYKYCGKELDRMLSLDWLDHGARMYDPVVARWWRMDPMAEKDYDVSPYAMCHNDPINRVDLNGMDDLFDQNGAFIMRTEKGDAVLMATSEGYKNITEIDFSHNHGALKNIAGHYLGGVSNRPFILEVSGVDKNTPNGAVFFNVQGSNKFGVCLDENGHVNFTLGNCYNFENVAFHEQLHETKEYTWGRTIGEVNAVLEEIGGHDSWKKTTTSYKRGQAAYAAMSLEKYMEQKDFEMPNVKDAIKNLNNAFKNFATFELEGKEVNVLFSIGGNYSAIVQCP